MYLDAVSQLFWTVIQIFLRIVASI